MDSIHNIVGGLEGVSSLTFRDELIFKEQFKKYPACYANSWLYILRAARNEFGELGWKFQHKNDVIGIGYRNRTFYLVGLHEQINLDVLQRLCESLALVNNSRVLLKKVNADLYVRLLGTKRFRATQELLNTNFLEDEAFPEHIIDLERLFLEDFTLRPERHNLNKKVKRFDQIGRILQADFAPVASKSEIADNLLKITNGDMAKASAYLPIAEEVFLLQRNAERYRSCIFGENSNIHGIYIADKLAGDTLGLYCALSSKEYPGLTEWMDVSFFVQMYRGGFKAIYLGGSETMGVHSYVQKLMPSKPPYEMIPLVYN